MEVINDVLSFIRHNWAVLVFFGTLVWGSIKLSINSNYVRHEDLRAVKAELHESHLRLTRVEQKLDGLPSSEEIANLKLLMTEIRGDTKALAASVGGIGRQVDLLIEKEIKQ